jgi:ubiquinone/menaquinone biosynthesis C-methylase UbiE
MAGEDATGAVSFKEMEQSGWQEKASAYDDFAGQVTVQAMDALLDAAGVAAGTRLLDVASGPGYGAGAAAARGAKAIGVDFAEAMVGEAIKNFPGAEFQLGDGENLSFEDGSFDAVICPFGLLHMPEPDKAVLEAFRVLVSGSRYAFSVWTTPDTHEFFALVISAIQAHGNMDVPLPPAPPIFRFSDPEECKAVLENAGFVDTDVKEISPIWKATSGQQVLDMIYKGTVRTAAMLEYQAPEALEEIHNDILKGAEAYKTGDAYNLAWPAVIASASKP